MKALERRKLQKEFFANKDQAAAGGLKITQRRKIQKRQIEIQTLLGIGKKAVKAVTRLADLIEGKFNSIKPIAFMELVEDILKQGEAQLEEIKTPVINYYNEKLTG